MLGGVIPLLLTPFRENGDIDPEDLERLMDYFVDSGVDVFACLGEGSEAANLTDEEKIQVIEITLKKARHLPLIAGLTGQSMQSINDEISRLPAHQLSGYLIPPPRSVGMSRNEILTFYTKVDQIVDVPIVILDNPGKVRPVIPPELIVDIVRKTRNVRYLKIEEQPTMLKMENLNLLGEKRLKILGASHGRNFLWELERGAAGILTSTPLPSILVAIWKSFARGDKERATDIFYKSLPLASTIASPRSKSKKRC